MSSAEIQRGKLLILENDRALRRELETIFADLTVTVSETSEQALTLVRRIEPDVVLFDLGPAREPTVAAQNLELLRQILNLAPDTKIIAIGQDGRFGKGWGSVEIALLRLERGLTRS